MIVSAREVGNSLVVTIPKDTIKELSISKGDCFEVNVKNNELCFIPQKKRLKGEIFLEEYYNKPFNEIEPWECEDISTGEAVGEEIW